MSVHSTGSRRETARWLIGFPAALGIVLLIAHGAEAGTIAVDFTGGSMSWPNDNTNGWAFTVQPGYTVTVEKLLFFDLGSNGLTASHEIGIWKADTSPVVITVFPAGFVTPLIASTSAEGSWRSLDIADVVLTEGQYLIGAHGEYPDDEGRRFATASTMTGINFDGARSNLGDAGFGPPTMDLSALNDGWFGPSFEGSAVFIPEPGAGLLLGLGVGFLAACRRRA